MTNLSAKSFAGHQIVSENPGSLISGQGKTGGIIFLTHHNAQ